MIPHIAQKHVIAVEKATASQPATKRISREVSFILHHWRLIDGVVGKGAFLRRVDLIGQLRETEFWNRQSQKNSPWLAFVLFDERNVGEFDFHSRY